jgi:hypothetical protein
MLLVGISPISWDIHHCERKSSHLDNLFADACGHGMHCFLKTLIINGAALDWLISLRRNVHEISILCARLFLAIESRKNQTVMSMMSSTLAMNYMFATLVSTLTSQHHSIPNDKLENASTTSTSSPTRRCSDDTYDGLSACESDICSNSAIVKASESAIKLPKLATLRDYMFSFFRRSVKTYPMLS